GRCSCMPKSTQRWRTNLSSSSKVPSSRRSSMRSRAVSLPALCSRSRRSGPPPASASVLRRRKSSIRSWCLALEVDAGAAGDGAGAGRLSGKGFSRCGCFVLVEDAYGKVRGEPGGAEKEDNAEEQFGADSNGALRGRFDRRY